MRVRQIVETLAFCGFLVSPVLAAPAADRWSTCLPDAIQSRTVVATQRVKSGRIYVDRQVTVRDVLIKFKARCRRGKLVDRQGRGIYFYRLLGCWGNPPADYQEQLQREREEIARLGKEYRVIEISCAQTTNPRMVH